MEIDVRLRTDAGQVRLERAVELDGVDVVDAVGEVAREDAEPRSDLEHDVCSVELGEPADDAEDVLVGQEVLAEPLLRRHVHARPKTAVAFASIWPASSPASSPRTSASVVSVGVTKAGSFVLPRTGCGAR